MNHSKMEVGSGGCLRQLISTALLKASSKASKSTHGSLATFTGHLYTGPLSCLRASIRS